MTLIFWVGVGGVGLDIPLCLKYINKTNYTCTPSDTTVPLATEPGMKILQRNLNGSTFAVWEMKRNVSVVRVIVATQSRNILISCKIIKEMPDSVASGTHVILEEKLRIYTNFLCFLILLWDVDPSKNFELYVQ